jgi:hypothetical protein
MTSGVAFPALYCELNCSKHESSVQAVPEELRDEVDQPGRTGPSARTQDSTTVPTVAAAAATLGAASQGKRNVDDAYFDSYSYFDIHREMLVDKVRTEAYRYLRPHCASAAVFLA